MALSVVEETKEIINNIKEYKEKITLTWIRALMGNSGNEIAYQLTKDATLISDETIRIVLSSNQKRNDKIIKELWQNRWNVSNNSRWTKTLIDKVNLDRLLGDFYINFDDAWNF
ncbi:hypothetical protein AVEN_263570-1 [Araneus ventricosus]|uniref:Uncharacterized protein n=1 Tax=Araneus ventricosus TaxID=182803 RepID=A0A4Y2HTL8_ARAVE|nr:hypothetical protein AVEN_263570-1 [Araneus ventricosus]